MKISDLQYSEKVAPTIGYCLAYTRDDIVFEKYNSLNDICYLVDDTKELLELHLFDDEKEYRAIYSGSSNNASFIEHLCEVDRLNEDNVYSVDTLVDDKYRSVADKIKIVNILEYDDNGALRVVDYRLMIGE